MVCSHGFANYSCDMQSIRKLYDGDSAAQHAHATDRFARKIEGILVLSRAARLRRLMRNPFGGNFQAHFE
jgi:hypothetical protein